MEYVRCLFLLLSSSLLLSVHPASASRCSRVQAEPRLWPVCIRSPDFSDPDLFTQARPCSFNMVACQSDAIVLTGRFGSTLGFASYRWCDVGIMHLRRLSGPQFLHL